MYPDIPPDLFGVIDAIRFYQQLYIVIVIFQAPEIPGNTSSGKLIENFSPERFITCIAAFPKRGIGAQGKNVGQKIPYIVSDLNGNMPALKTNVHVQTKDQVRARSFLQFIY